MEYMAVHGLADEAVDMVAAVSAIRNQPEPTSGYQVIRRARKGKQNAAPTKTEAKCANTTVLQVEQEGKKRHNLLEADCKAASHFLRTAMYGEGLMEY
jgi:hypothetical protein